MRCLNDCRRHSRSLAAPRAIAALAVMAASVGGCASTPDVPREREVLLGGLFSLTGNWSTLGQTSRAAMEFAVEDVNQYLAGNAAGVRFVPPPTLERRGAYPIAPGLFRVRIRADIPPGHPGGSRRQSSEGSSNVNKMTAAVALMAVFTLAVCFILLGSVSSDLMTALALDEAQFGSLIMALFLTSCVVQLFVGPAVDRFGYKPLAILGFVVTSASIFMLAFATSFATAFLAWCASASGRCPSTRWATP